MKRRAIVASVAIGILVIVGMLASGSYYAGAQVGEKQQVGRQKDGTVVTTSNQVLTPAGRQVEFRGRPNAVTLSPDRKIAAFLSAGYKAVMLVDVETGMVKQEFDAAGPSASFSGIVYSKDGKTLYASQATGNLIIAKVADDGTIALDQVVKLPPNKIFYPGADGNPYPGGLALSDDGKTLYICLNRTNSLGVFDLASRRMVKEIAVGNAPTNVVISGDKAYVSNRGGRPANEGDFTVDSSGTPIVAQRESGYAITGTVSVVDLKANVEMRTIEVGLHPTALLLDGRRLFVANTNSDTVSIIDVATDRVIKTIAVKPFPGALLGSSPNALAMVESQRLVVSLGRNNALAVYSLSDHLYGGVAFLGLIPTGWYPASIAVDPEKRRLIVANNRGVGALGPEVATGPWGGPNVKKGRGVFAFVGSTSIISFPTDSELLGHTPRVLKNNNWERVLGEQKRGRATTRAKKPVPVPKELGDPSVFKHVFYIIKENRTYDQVLGGLPKGNGDPNLVQFGRNVTPNHHALAEEFVLFDNLYDSGTNSADTHQWVTQAFVVDYVEKSFGGWARTYPFNAGDALVYPQTGFLWENALKFGKSVRVYGEYASGLKADGVVIGPWTTPWMPPAKAPWLGGSETEGGLWTDFYKDAQILAGKLPGPLRFKLETYSDIPSLDRILNRDYPSYRQNIPDQYRVEIFLKEFKEYVKNGNLPNLIIMALTNDHTEGNKPHYPTPAAMVADNDLAIGRVVEAISHSPYWKNSAIFVIEDDAQFGVDHVSGHRTIGFVISPYTKRRVVDSRYYTMLDMIRTMEQILGLPPMNQMDMAIDPQIMKDVFTDKPSFTPYKTLSNQVALDTLNPPLAAMDDGIEKEWALAMYKEDFSKPDAADTRLLNRVIWYSTKGWDKPYPGDDRVLYPNEVHSYLAEKAEKVQGEK
jgi:YVTN family beta-propeller protein